jgi:hypothetical protein
LMSSVTAGRLRQKVRTTSMDTGEMLQYVYAYKNSRENGR